MSSQTDLFNIQEEAVYCIDTCIFLNCLKISDDEPYAMDVIPGALEYIEKLMISGKAVSTVAVYQELKKREDKVEGLKDWLKSHKEYFLEEDFAQAMAMKPIANQYPVYTTDKGDYGDISVIGFAKSRNLTVVTSESRKDQHKKTHPKVPNVCDEFEVPCLSMIGFLRAEGVVLNIAQVLKPSQSPVSSEVTEPAATKQKVEAT